MAAPIVSDDLWAVVAPLLPAAHAALDRAVWAAYGWDDADPGETNDEEILGRLLTLNGERAAP